MRLHGFFVIAASLLLPLWWFIPLGLEQDKSAVFSQYIGSTALIAMALAQVMATRLPGIEALFGGMDQVYRQHKWLGIGALMAILLHDTIDAEIRSLGGQTMLSELGETLGEISLYGFLILIMITLITFIPYPLWKWSHKAMGAFFTASALHYVWIQKPFDAVADPVGLYVTVFCFLGVLSYGYTLLPVAVQAKHRYRVAHIEKSGEAMAITLEPVGRGLAHRAGQFTFVGFRQAGFGEHHPFTISKAPTKDRKLRFSVKALGDYTARLPQLEVGSLADVSASFGHFGTGMKRRHQIWIAGGIGITPFVALAEALPTNAPTVDLFYAVKDAKRAAHLAELQALAADKPNLNLHVYQSSQGQRLSARDIVAMIDGPLSARFTAYCGPAGLRETLKRDLQKAGLPTRRFAYEAFEIRSGLGLRRLVMWLWPQIIAKLASLAPKVRALGK